MKKANKRNNYLYNPELKEKASSLRKNMTKAETVLWKYALKDRQLAGYRFNRQRPVLNYIVDFVCKELLLIIEIDGYIHTIESVVKQDQKKQKDLEAAGFKVLRYNDEDVLENMEQVIIDIKNRIKNIK